MKGSFLIFCSCFLISLSLPAQKTDRILTEKTNSLLKGFNGVVGVYIKDLKKNKIVSINADTLFPTASMVKVPILLGIMDKIEKGQLQYHQEFIYKDSLLYSGSDILGAFKNNESIELAKLIMLMLTTSDNTASLWLQSIAGTGTRINELLDSNGFQFTRVNSRTTGRQANREAFGWGQTTPFEMAQLLEKIYEGKLISNNASKKMLRLLGRNYWDEQAISQIPPDIFVASKNGAVDASRSELLLVMAPEHPYIFCICTKQNKDISWEDRNEAWMLAKNLSKLLWDYFGKDD
ncbi:MAG: serine hydrolase [Chitinophagaceae bacterium]